MRTYIIKRLIFMVITLFVISVISYTMIRLAPGDPIRSQMLGAEGQGIQQTERKESSAQELRRKKYYIDKPPLVAYCYWMRDVFKYGDLGASIVVDPETPVLKVIAERIPPTLKLNILSIILVYACAIPIGIYAALRSGKWDERIVTVLLFILYSMPVFWVGLMLMVLFCGNVWLDIFPVAGLTPDSTWGMNYWRILVETARHYALPVLCLTYGSLAGLSRYARVGILEIIRQDYVRTARAKGLSEWRVILKHVFRNGLIPLITLFAGLLPGLIAGSIIVEHIFSIPGMGSLTMLALSSRDHNLLMGLFVVGSTLTLLGILVSDILYAAVDPRVRFE